MIKYLQERSDRMDNILLEPIRNSEGIILFDNIGELNFSGSCAQLSSNYEGVHLYIVDDDFFDYDYDSDEAYKHKKSIGYFLGRFFDVDYSMNNGLDLFTMFDMPDEIPTNLINAVLDEDCNFKNEIIPENIYFLEEITIAEDYVGKGYGKLIVQNIQKMLTYILKLNVSNIILKESVLKKIYDSELETIKNEYDSFKEFYRCVGFKKLEKTKYLISYIEEKE